MTLMEYKILLAILIIFLFILRLQSAIISLGSFYLTFEPMLLHPHATYSEKMSMKYPVYFDYITQVKTLTSDDSTIYIPSIQIPYEDDMWPIANLPITSALLFPRKVIYLNDQKLPDLKNNSYVVIADGFPEEKIKANTIFIIGKNLEIFSGNYDPARFSNTDNGLIKL
jgi:hypothetical protein